MEFLKSNLWEIKKSSVLQVFGGLLGLAHLLTYIYWYKAGNLPLYYHSNPQPMCWTLFENCDWVKFLSPALMEFTFHAYGIVAAIVTLLFFATRLIDAEYQFDGFTTKATQSLSWPRRAWTMYGRRLNRMPSPYRKPLQERATL